MGWLVLDNVFEKGIWITKNVESGFNY
jgi:hypothetical protein